MLAIVFYLLSLGVFGAALDDGPFIDPNGGIRAAVNGQEGCGLDPFGRPCTQQLDTDDGNGFDPHG